MPRNPPSPNPATIATPSASHKIAKIESRSILAWLISFIASCLGLFSKTPEQQLLAAIEKLFKSSTPENQLHLKVQFQQILEGSGLSKEEIILTIQNKLDHIQRHVTIDEAANILSWTREYTKDAQGASEIWDAFIRETLFKKSGLARIDMTTARSAEQLFEELTRNCSSLASDPVYKMVLQEETARERTADAVQKTIVRTLITTACMDSSELADMIEEPLQTWPNGQATHTQLDLLQQALFRRPLFS